MTAAVRYTKGPERKMGKVLTTITVTNSIDAGMARRGILDPGRVRSIALSDVLVGTGATTLCLPADVVAHVGLDVLEEVMITTAAGPSVARIVGGVLLEVEGRRGEFDCVELPAGTNVLLGVLPLERLGLEPDLANQRLRLLSNTGRDNYLTVL